MRVHCRGKPLRQQIRPLPDVIEDLRCRRTAVQLPHPHTVFFPEPVRIQIKEPPFYEPRQRVHFPFERDPDPVQTRVEVRKLPRSCHRQCLLQRFVCRQTALRMDPDHIQVIRVLFQPACPDLPTVSRVDYDPAMAAADVIRFFVYVIQHICPPQQILWE